MTLAYAYMLIAFVIALVAAWFIVLTSTMFTRRGRDEY
jgi:hypothetical protein